MSNAADDPTPANALALIEDRPTNAVSANVMSGSMARPPSAGMAIDSISFSFLDKEEEEDDDDSMRCCCCGVSSSFPSVVIVDAMILLLLESMIISVGDDKSGDISEVTSLGILDVFVF